MAVEVRRAQVSPTRQRALCSAIDSLCASITQGNTEEFVRLLKREIPSLHEAFDSAGLSPLHVTVMACKSHRQWRKMSCTLLFYQDRLRLDVNIRSRNPRMMGWTALDFACMFNAKAIKILQRHGCEACEMTFGRLGGYNHRQRLRFDMELAQIREIAFPNPLQPPPLQFECPQSLKPLELYSQLPECEPGFLIEGLLHFHAIFPYRPIGSMDGVRYCFPAYFPSRLPQNQWVHGKPYVVYAGRFLSPLTCEIDLQEVFLQLLAHVLSRIDDKSSVSQSSFCFITPHGTQCRVAVVEYSKGRGQPEEGMQVLVRSNKPLCVSIPDACAICDHLVQLAQTLSHDALSFGVLSSFDLHNGEPSPHVYTSAEVREAKATNLVHPSGRVELHLTLLLEPYQPYGTREQTPIKQGQVPGYQPAPVAVLGSFEPAERKPTVRKLHYYPPDYSWSAEVCKEAVFKRCYVELVDHMLPEYLVPPLVEAGYLTPQEVDNVISPYIDPKRRSMFLLGRLKTSLRAKRDFYHFFNVLREETEHLTHQELERSLIKACTDIEARQKDTERGLSLSPCGLEWQPTYHSGHPSLGQQSPPHIPDLDGSYSSRAASRADTGFDSTTSYDFPHSKDRSVTLSTHQSNYCASGGDSGTHSRPSTGRSQSRLRVLQAGRINKTAADFSTPLWPGTLPPSAQVPGKRATDAIASHRRLAVQEGPTHTQRTSGDSDSTSSTPPFSLSTEVGSNSSTGSSRSASTSKHLSDDITRTCTPDFIQVFINFLLLLNSLPDEDSRLLPGLGFKM